MAANDNVCDIQNGNGELNARSHTAGRQPARRHDVSSVANRKDFGRLRLGEERGANPGIRAGNEQSARMLAEGQPVEQILLPRKHVPLRFLNP